MSHSNNTFETGYKYGIDNLEAFLGGELTRQANQPYLESIQKEIDKLINR